MITINIKSKRGKRALFFPFNYSHYLHVFMAKLALRVLGRSTGD